MTLADSYMRDAAVSSRAAARPRPSSGEAPFGVDEIFYSRTDSRGVIRSGNEVFRRVSDYGWEQMIGAPHRLVRHPDMPKGVFWLLWDRIKRGRITGAYVKNRTRDGLHYWVFAVITPLDGGYLSVRIKPGSKIFDRAQALYADLIARESGGLSPADSASALLSALGEDGFNGYDDFMACALASEISARDKSLDRPRPPRLEDLTRINSLLREALRQKFSLLSAFDDIRAIPTNLHIVASRLKVYGGPVSTIAENYRLMSTDVTRRLQEVAHQGEPGDPGGAGVGRDGLQSTVSEALFLTGAAHLMSELSATCATEPGDSPFDADEEAARLVALDDDFRRRAVLSLAGVGRAAATLAGTCEELKRLMLGLDSIRVLCRVEAGRMSGGAEGLQAIIMTLDRFHADVAQRLDKILDLSRQVRSATEAATREDS